MILATPAEHTAATGPAGESRAEMMVRAILAALPLDVRHEACGRARWFLRVLAGLSHVDGECMPHGFVTQHGGASEAAAAVDACCAVAMTAAGAVACSPVRAEANALLCAVTGDDAHTLATEFGFLDAREARARYQRGAKLLRRALAAG